MCCRRASGSSCTAAVHKAVHGRAKPPRIGWHGPCIGSHEWAPMAARAKTRQQDNGVHPCVPGTQRDGRRFFSLRNPGANDAKQTHHGLPPFRPAERGRPRRRQPRRRVPRDRHGAGHRARDQGRQAGIHRAHRRRAAVRGRREGLLQEARHDRGGGAQAVLLGRDARQPGAGLQEQRHRRRPHPVAHALPDHLRGGHGQQRAGADPDPGAPEPGRPVHLGGQRIQGPEGRRGHQGVQEGAAGQAREDRQGGERRHDLPRRHPRHVAALLDGRGRRGPQPRHQHHHGPRRWWPT